MGHPARGREPLQKLFVFLTENLRFWALVSRNRKTCSWKKLEILVQNQSFWNIVGARPTAAPGNSGRDNAAGITIVWRTSPPLILHIDCKKLQLSHVPLRRREIIVTSFHGFGTNYMVHSDWDSALRCVCSPNFKSDHDFISIFFEFTGLRISHGIISRLNMLF